jgi:hypothetical protein
VRDGSLTRAFIPCIQLLYWPPSTGIHIYYLALNFLTVPQPSFGAPVTVYLKSFQARDELKLSFVSLKLAVFSSQFVKQWDTEGFPPLFPNSRLKEYLTWQHVSLHSIHPVLSKPTCTFHDLKTSVQFSNNGVCCCFAKWDNFTSELYCKLLN